MSCDKKCVWCMHFIYKIMLNGYHGVCDKEDGGLVKFNDNCDDFTPGTNKIYEHKEDS